MKYYPFAVLAVGLAQAQAAAADTLVVSPAVYDGNEYFYYFNLVADTGPVLSDYQVQISGVAAGSVTIDCTRTNACWHPASVGDVLSVDNPEQFTFVENYADSQGIDSNTGGLAGPSSAGAVAPDIMDEVIAARRDELTAQSERVGYAMAAIRQQRLGWSLISQTDANSVGVKLPALPVSLTYTQETGGRERFDLLSGFSAVNGPWVVTGLASVGGGQRAGVASRWVAVASEAWLRGGGFSGPFVGLQHHQGAEDAGPWGAVALSDWQSSALQARLGYRTQWGVATWWGAGVVELGAGVVSNDWRVAGTVYAGASQALNISQRSQDGFVQLSFRAQGPRNQLSAALQLEGDRASLGLTLGW